MTSQGWKSLLTPESSALARFRADRGAWRELAFPQQDTEAGGGAGAVGDPGAAARTALLWSIQYDWQPGDLPLLRFLLAQQVLAAEHAGSGTSAWLDDLARAVRLVARGRDEGDAAQLYDAVRLLVTNPAQADESWVGYYSQLAASQSGLGQEETAAELPDAGVHTSGVTGGEHPQYFHHIGLGELPGPGKPGGLGRPAGASVPGVLGDPARLGETGAHPADGDGADLGLGVLSALDRLDAVSRLGRLGSFDAFGEPRVGHAPDQVDESPEPGEPVPSAWPQRSLEPATPYVAATTPPGPTMPQHVPAEPARPAAPGAGLLAEPAGDRSIESQVSRAFMAGGAGPAVSVIGEWAANRPENFESLNTQTELFASLGEYGAAADAARRLVALPDPDQPDPDLARFEALRRVARLERQSGSMDAAWRSLTAAQQDLAEHPFWRDQGPGQALATEYFLLSAAVDPQEPLARAALKTGDKLARKLAPLDEYLRQVALRAAEHCADERLRRRYDRPIG